jgi:hypothetical protein
MAALVLSENAWFAILAIGAVAIALGIAAYFGKKRAEGMEKAATEMGYSYEKKGAPFLQELDKSLHLLNQGSSKNLSNLLRGPNGQAIFDYHFQTGGVDARTTKNVTQTVAAFRYPSAAFPQFSLGAEHWWHKAASAVGYQMIRFDTHPVFSKRYLLRGGDETAVRSFFMPPLLDYFQSLPEKPTWSVEAAGPWLLVYQPNRTVKAAELRNFAEETAGVAREVTGRSGMRV